MVVPSGRFVLRRYVVGDVEPLARAVAESLDHLRLFMPWAADEPVAPDARLALFAEWDRAWEEGSEAIYGMFTGDGPGGVTVVGGCGLHRRTLDRPDVVEIGYWVHVEHVRRGIATEAAGALTDAAFAMAGTSTVEVWHDPANRASRGVPLRLGYRYLGGDIERAGQLFDVWQVTRAEWAARPAPPP